VFPSSSEVLKHSLLVSFIWFLRLLSSITYHFSFDSSFNIFNCTHNSLAYLFFCTYSIYSTRLGVLQGSVLSHLLISLSNDSLGEISSTCITPSMPHSLATKPCSGVIGLSLSPYHSKYLCFLRPHQTSLISSPENTGQQLCVHSLGIYNTPVYTHVLVLVCIRVLLRL
jgi:hypothetical protein